ncbi:MAG: single-stranded-DNA-specific exonuclease RecJ [Deltaproteobacteria bacterium]|nr:single-stranded-DNA-specific exonuclease RecJ [Deltaproteobacteria bacterium]
MSPSKQWQLKAPDIEKQNLFSKALGISTVTAQILINRGVDSLELAQSFLNPTLKNLPNPFLLPDMEKGVARILKAIREKEKIAVYGDYDVDGLSSASLFATYFRESGIEVTVYIPDRIKEGYGLQADALKSLQSRGISLVVTADCGSKSHAALSEAKKMGLDVIVTDHHQIDATDPETFAFINPQRLPKGSPGQELAGVGMIFFLLMALRQKMRDEKLFQGAEPNLKQHLDLVALGTIGDMAPMTGINRILIRFGLEALATTTKPGLIALKEVTKLGAAKTIDPSDIGFRLAPRINAGGRIAKASLGVDLLCATDLDRAHKLAKILDQCNQERQSMQEKHVKEALELAAEKKTKFSLVVASKGWHPGIVGLVASKMTETFHRPSIALSIEGDVARGSARSITGIDIVTVLEKCTDLLVQFGGHTAAAGLTLKIDKLELFEERFEETVREAMSDDMATPILHIDCELDFSEIHEKLLAELELLKPFGIKNPEPLFSAKKIKFFDTKIVGEKHLKFKVSDRQKEFAAIAFNMGNIHPLKTDTGDCVFVPQWNIYLDTKTIQLKVKDIRYFQTTP